MDTGWITDNGKTYYLGTELKTCMHEMGHALDLGDNDSADVMYGTKSSTTTLTTNDKRSYDISYNR